MGNFRFIFPEYPDVWQLFQEYIWYIAGKNRVVLNTVLTAIMVILIGYSSNAIIVIRASANTPLNENQSFKSFQPSLFPEQGAIWSASLVQGAVL